MARSGDHIEKIELAYHRKCLLRDLFIDEKVLQIGNNLSKVSIFHLANILGQDEVPVFQQSALALRLVHLRTN